MNPYIVETKYATNNLINREEERLKAFYIHLTEHKKRHEILYKDFFRKDLDPYENFTEADMMRSFYYQADYDKEFLTPLRSAISEVENSIEAKKESIQALSGALLQIAKKGISIVHGGLNFCPDGRFIKTEPIKNIIWQGRNQSLHFEIGSFHTPVVNCFNALGIPINNQNSAKLIIDLLGWTSDKNYQDDMVLLLG